MKINLTAHVLVKNEENFIWFAIKSVISFVDKIIIYDTGSTDNTAKIIESIKSKKIIFKKFGSQSPEKIIDLRNQQVMVTKTKWFLLLDGDEVWPKKSITALVKKIQKINPQKIGIVVKSINCIGDIYHQLPQEKGQYRLLGKKGHFNIRAYRKFPNYSWKGTYPLEGYFDKNNKVFLNDQDEKLDFLNVPYWHLTHLPRSRHDSHQRIKYDLGHKILPRLLPQVFFEKTPSFVSNPLKKQNLFFLLVATVLHFLRKIIK